MSAEYWIVHLGKSRSRKSVTLHRSSYSGSQAKLWGTYLAGSGDLTGEKTAEMVGGLHHGTVAADVRHGGQRVKRLDERINISFNFHQLVGGLHHGAVSADVRHGGQRVKRLEKRTNRSLNFHQMVGGLHHSGVAADVRHRGQRVKRL